MTLRTIDLLHHTLTLITPSLVSHPHSYHTLTRITPSHTPCSTQTHNLEPKPPLIFGLSSRLTNIHTPSFHSHNGPSLIPRPHPLTKINGLMNQVEFLGLAHALATANKCSRHFVANPLKKRYRFSSGDKRILLL